MVKAIISLLCLLSITHLSHGQCGAEIAETGDCLYGVFEKIIGKLPNRRDVRQGIYDCHTASGCELPYKKWGVERMLKDKDTTKFLNKMGLKDIDFEVLKTAVEALPACAKEQIELVKPIITECMTGKPNFNDFVIPGFVDKLKQETSDFERPIKDEDLFGEAVEELLGLANRRRYGRLMGRRLNYLLEENFEHHGVEYELRELQEVCPSEETRQNMIKCIDGVVDQNTPDEFKCKSPLSILAKINSTHMQACTESKACVKKMSDDCAATRKDFLTGLVECATEGLETHLEELIESMKKCLQNAVGEAPLLPPKADVDKIKKELKKIAKEGLGYASRDIERLNLEKFTEECDPPDFYELLRRY